MTATSFLHWAEPLAKLVAVAAAYYVEVRLDSYWPSLRGMPQRCGQHPASL